MAAWSCDAPDARMVSMLLGARMYRSRVHFVSQAGRAFADYDELVVVTTAVRPGGAPVF